MSITEHKLSLFDEWIHDTYYSPEEGMGKVVLVESDDDYRDFRRWATSNNTPVAYDVETKGIDIYRDYWDMHTLQWGDENIAYVFVEGDPRLKESIEVMLSTERTLVAHNATYDVLVLDKKGYTDALQVLDRTQDTFILSHLVDPVLASGAMGGTHGLKALAAVYVHESAKESAGALERFFKSNKWTMTKGYRNIPSSHPTLVQYGGMDVILTTRLYHKLLDEVKSKDVMHLVDYEHTIQRNLVELQRKGIKLDVEYAESIAAVLGRQETELVERLSEYGVTDIYSTQKVANVLRATGVVLTKVTNSGKYCVDQDILAAIAAKPPNEKAENIAKLCLKAKHTNKLRKTYILPMLAMRDSQDRIHATIKSLGARTARMAVSTPPLQQLPSDDDIIRRALLAEDGHKFCAVDFSGVELRVLAALSKDSRMINAFQNGEDIHQLTATALGVDRHTGKTVNFAKVYGGGAETLALTAKCTVDQALTMMRKFNATYPGVRTFDRELSGPIKSGQINHIRTKTNRYMPVDAARPYSAVNYAAQSAARDVLCKAIVNLGNSELWQYALLPVHDEILFSFPKETARDMAEQAGALMESVMDGVHMKAEVKVGQDSWGSLYANGEYEEVELSGMARAKYGTKSVRNLFS